MAAVTHHSNGLDSLSKEAPTRPVVARMYDWYLGGTHNYEIDRKAAADVEKCFPDIKAIAIENRMFLCRAVRWLAQNGVTQFIDVGCGLPTVGSTHEAVLKVAPNARIQYVDIEESVVDEGKQFIKETGWEKQVGMVQASALEPAGIVAHPEVRRVIDFSKPVVIMMVALTHFWTIEQYESVLGYWKKTLVKGSALVMTHATEEGRTAEELEGIYEAYARTPTPIILRSKEEIAPLMDGWAMVEPGLVRPHQWKEELMEDGEKWPLTGQWWVAVGFLK